MRHLELAPRLERGPFGVRVATALGRTFTGELDLQEQAVETAKLYASRGERYIGWDDRYPTRDVPGGGSYVFNSRAEAKAWFDQHVAIPDTFYAAWFDAGDPRWPGPVEDGGSQAGVHISGNGPYNPMKGDPPIDAVDANLPDLLRLSDISELKLLLRHASIDMVQQRIANANQWFNPQGVCYWGVSVRLGQKAHDADAGPIELDGGKEAARTWLRKTEESGRYEYVAVFATAGTAIDDYADWARGDALTSVSTT
jgi:hypothetical protein